MYRISCMPPYLKIHEFVKKDLWRKRPDIIACNYSPAHRHGPARKLRPHNDFNGFRSTNVSRMACARPIFKKKHTKWNSDPYLINYAWY